MSQTRVLILGGSGMLGHKLCQLLPGCGFDVAATLRGHEEYRHKCPEVYQQVELVYGVDALEDRQLDEAIRRVDPQVIVNCIGIVRQLPEAEDAYLSVAINAMLPHKLARWCGEQGRRLIHISTDCVFDGIRGRYRESDPSDARDLYGKSKFLGETTPAETAAMTLRTSMIGRELAAPGHGLLEWFLAQKGKRIRGFARTIYSGLTTHELARVISRAIQEHQDLIGVYQVGGQPINKYDLLLLIGKVFGLPIEIERDVAPICDRSLLTDRFHAATGYAAPTWEAMIDEMHRDSAPYDQWKSAEQVIAAH